MLKNLMLVSTLALTSVLLTACKTADSDCACCKPDSQWTVLFDGKSTDAFRGYKTDTFPGEKWKVEDSALHVLPGKSADLMTKEQYENYELELEWKTSPGGNSGIIYNVQETAGPAWHTGPEMQVLDDTGHGDGKKPATSAGALYAMIAPNADKTLKPVGEYNLAKLVVNKGHVEHWLNGKKVVEYTWGSPEIAALIQQSKFKPQPEFMKHNKGYIVFQHHGQEVWFRNIRIKQL
jgi:hypothetical protein